MFPLFFFEQFMSSLSPITVCRVWPPPTSPNSSPHMPQPEPAQANYSVCTHPGLGSRPWATGPLRPPWPPQRATDTGCLWKKDSPFSLIDLICFWFIWSDFLVYCALVRFAQMENALQILSWWGLHGIRTTTPALLQHWKLQPAIGCTSQLLFKQREALSVSLKALSSDLLTLISHENDSNEGNSKGAGPIPCGHGRTDW